MRWTEFIITLGQNLSNPSFWIGFVLVTVFAYGRFAISEADSEKDDPRLKARSFTTRFRYSLSAIAYIGIYEFYFGLLVGIGSLPFLQEMLTQWIGGLELPADNPTEVGTPAWAALFVTSVLPVAPGFRNFDTVIRRKLHKFASIPFKARGLALAIVDQLTPQFFNALENDESAAASRDMPEPVLKAAQLKWLFGAIDKLQNVNSNPGGAEDYNKFFASDYQGILKSAKEKMSWLEESLASPESAVLVIAPEREALLNKMARFLSCALLQNESSEREVRNVIRDKLEIDGFPPLPFDFSLKQIILNLILVLILTFLGSVVALGFTPAVGWHSISTPMIGTIFFWLPFMAITMVVPFVFAAGVQLYFMDRQQVERSSIPFEDKLLALIFLLVVTFAVGLLPSLLGMVAGDYRLSEDWVMQVVPSGLTPAVVALMFYFLSSRHIVGSTWIEALLDLIVFASAAGFCSWFAAMAAFQAGMDVEITMNVQGLTNDVVLIVSPVTHALMVGIIGAIQCSISRSNLDSMQRREEKDSSGVSYKSSEQRLQISRNSGSRDNSRIHPPATA
jgi:hypothetical protein